MDPLSAVSAIPSLVDLLRMLRGGYRRLLHGKKLANKFKSVKSEVDELFKRPCLAQLTENARNDAEKHKNTVKETLDNIEKNLPTSSAKLCLYGLRKGKKVDGELVDLNKMIEEYREAIKPNDARKIERHRQKADDVGLDRAEEVLNFVRMHTLPSAASSSTSSTSAAASSSATPAPILSSVAASSSSTSAPVNASPKLCIVGILGQGGLGKTYLLEHIQGRLSEPGGFKFVAQANLSEKMDEVDLVEQQLQLIKFLLPPHATAYEGPKSLPHGRGMLKGILKSHAASNESVCITIDDVWRLDHLEAILPDHIATEIPSLSCCIIITSQVQSMVGHLKQFCNCSSECPVLPFQLQLLCDKASRTLLVDHASTHNDELVNRIYPLCYGLPKALKVAGKTLAVNKETVFWDDWTKGMAADTPGLAAGLVQGLNNILDRSYGQLCHDSQEALCRIAACLHGSPRKTATNIVGNEGIMHEIQNYSLIRKGPVLEMHALIWKLACSSTRKPIESQDVIVCRGKKDMICEKVYYLRLDVRNADEFRNADMFCTEDGRLIGSYFKCMTPQLLALDMLGHFECSEKVLEIPRSLEFLRFQHNDCVREVLEKIQHVPRSLKQLEFANCKDVEKCVGELVSRCSRPDLGIVIDGVPIPMPSSSSLQPLGNSQPSSSSLQPLGNTQSSSSSLPISTPLGNSQPSSSSLQPAEQYSTALKSKIITTTSQLRALSEEQLMSLEDLTISVCDEPQERWSPSVKMAALEKLKLKGCGWTELEPGLFQKTASHLTKLSLRKCDQLTALPESIGFLRFLKKLVLKRCRKLKELPETIGNLQSLARLDVVDCGKLRRLFSSVKNLQDLEKLNVQMCGYLERLPQDMDMLKSLKELNLNYCQNDRFIEGLPVSLGKLGKHQLKKLYLEGLYTDKDAVPDVIKSRATELVVGPPESP